ncbi:MULTISPECIES: hypothetical protein [unclassified Caballeronia]|nr:MULTISPECIES: hypothetical protein [unclassified Caballeronia]
MTALMRAAGIGDAVCVKALLPLSDPHAAQEFGSTALLFCGG